MQRITTTLTRLGIVPALACSVGLAQAADGSQDQQRMTLQGEVEGFSAISLSQDGQRQERGLARIRLENGRSAIVDLGESRDLRNVDIEQGDHVTVGGTKTTIQDRTVLRADRLRVREQDQQGRQQSRRSGSDATVTMQGDIRDTKRMRGSHGEATLLKIRLENGEERMVVIPPGFDLTRVSLRDADRIKVMGKEVEKPNGHQCVVAKRVRIDGREIPWRESAGGSQKAHTQQARGQDQRQQQDQRQPSSQAQGDRSRTQSRQGRSMATLSGTVDRFATVRLSEAPEDNLFARVRMEDGSSRIVDFGRISSAKLLELEAGDQVQIKGLQRRLGDHRVLEARSVRIRDRQQGQRQDLMRSGVESVRGQRQQGQQDQGVRNRSIMLQGTVEGIKQVQIQGRNDKLTVMKLKLKDGTSKIVNLSPYLAEEVLEIEQGDEIVASGIERQTQQGKTILVVDGILVTDNRQARAE